MKIIFFTQEDPFYVKTFFDEFLRRYAPLDEIKAIVLSSPMGKKTTVQLASQMYNFYGPRDFLRMGARYAFVRLMQHRHMTRVKPGAVPKTYTVKQLAAAYGIDVLERSDLNSIDFRQIVKQYEADLFISVASPIIFRKDLIAIPKIDCINIHNAPLPKYRGMLPNFWQLYHGEQRAGITIHRISEGIDTGDIVTQQYVPIDAGETLDGLILKTKRMGAGIMMKIIEDYRSGQVCYRKMEGEGSYFTFPGRQDVREFRRRGRRLL